jgi:hypothetical protein
MEEREYFLSFLNWSFLLRVSSLILAALNSRDPEIISITLKVLQKLVTCSETIGEALVPYYRQILPIFNLYKNKNHNFGDKIDYSQRK